MAVASKKKSMAKEIDSDKSPFASSSFSGNTIAYSNLKVEITIEIPMIALKIPNSPKSEGLNIRAK